MATVVGELAQSENAVLSGIVRSMAADGGLVGRLTDSAARFQRYPAVQAATYMALDEILRVMEVDGALEEAEAYGEWIKCARCHATA